VYYNFTNSISLVVSRADLLFLVDTIFRQYKFLQPLTSTTKACSKINTKNVKLLCIDFLNMKSLSSFLILKKFTVSNVIGLCVVSDFFLQIVAFFRRLFYKIVDLGDFFNKKGDIFWTFFTRKKIWS